MIKNGKCLCGAEIVDGNEAYKHLMEQIKFVPPESIGTTIKNFKKDIRQYDKTNEDDRFYSTIQSKIADMLRFNGRISEWQSEIDQIEKQIEGKEDARKYQLELNDVKTRLKAKIQTKELAIAKIAEAESRKDRFKKIYDALVAISDKGKEIRRYLAYAERIQAWIQNYYNEEESKIRNELQERVNTIFQRMYHGERLLE